MNHQKTNPTPIHYYPNGNIKSEKVDINSFEYYYNEYYENGNLKFETPFYMNLHNGAQKEYYVCGNLKSKIPYFMGKQMGTKKRYFKSGVLKRQQRQRNSDREEGCVRSGIV